MVDYEEAKTIAFRFYSGYDLFQEMEKSFVFATGDHDGDGGFGAPVVVSKETGDTAPIHVAIADGLLDEDFGEFSPIPA